MRYLFTLILLFATVSYGAIVEDSNATYSMQASSSIAIVHGLTISSGSVIIAMVHVNGAGVSVTDNNGSFPFTTAYSHDPDYASSVYYIGYRVAGDSEPNTYTWTLGSAQDVSVQIRVFSGVDTNSVFDVAPSITTEQAGTGSSTFNVKSITTLTDGAFGILAAFGDGTGFTLSSPSNGYGDEVEPNPDYRVQASYTQTWASAGATGTCTVTCSYGLNYATQHFALKPAGAEPEPPASTGKRPRIIFIN